MFIRFNKIVVVAIVGMSMSGKDTLANMLIKADKCKNKEKADWRLLTSFTTRKMRVGETQGKEHTFLDDIPNGLKEEDFFARVDYGGAAYWTTKLQVQQCKKNLYIVDEESMRALKQLSTTLTADKKANPIPEAGSHEWPWEFRLVSVLVKRDAAPSDANRTGRDEGRTMDESEFDFVVENNGTLDDLEQQAAALLTKLNRTANKYLTST